MQSDREARRTARGRGTVPGRRAVRRLLTLRGRLARARRRHKLVGSARIALREVASLRTTRSEARREREFDQRHGVDTAGIVHLAALDIVSPNKDLGVRYQAANPALVRRLLAQIPVESGEYVFMDFGAGKGRTALLASEFPFRRVVGVEFSQELVDVARANAARFRSGAQRCHDIEFLCLDAVDIEIPADPVVLFFYNPFGEPVMHRVMERVCASLDRNPRPAYVVLMGDDELARPVERGGFVRVAGEGPAARIFGTVARPVGWPETTDQSERSPGSAIQQPCGACRTVY
jgi:SAM-dependent methyltransferase